MKAAENKLVIVISVGAASSSERGWERRDAQHFCSEVEKGHQWLPNAIVKT